MNNLPWPLLAVLIGSLLTTATGLYAWVATIRAGLESRVSEVERRVDIIDERAKHVPSAEQVHELNVAIAKLHTEMENVLKSIDALWHKLDLYEEWFKSREGSG